MKTFFARFIRDEAGMTVIEYGLIAALISVVCVAGMTFVGGQLGAIVQLPLPWPSRLLSKKHDGGKIIDRVCVAYCPNPLPPSKDCWI